MYTVRIKKVGDTRHLAIKSFSTYRKAYAYIGDLLQEIDTLHWGGRIKNPCMYDGYEKVKLFQYGTTCFKRKNRIYTITESPKTIS